MMEAFSVEVGDLSDIPVVMGVMTAAFEPAHGEAWTAAQCAGAMVIPGTQLFVARADDEIVGFALARRVVDETELLLLAVSPDLRGRGVGRSIMSKLTDDLRARGVQKLFLEVRENNPARKFYAKLSFEQVGFRKNYYRGVSGIYTDAVTLSLAL